MGMGEPLLNFRQVMRSLETLSSGRGLNFSPRRITVSTCGLEQGLRELGESGLAYLAVSLHAPDQALRARLMPAAARWPLEDLLRALEGYSLGARERLTFEYLLLGGVNDAPEQARALARIANRLSAKVNLIAYNPAAGAPYRAPTPERLLAFERELWQRGVTAILRKSKGQDIEAACGQLKAACEQYPSLSPRG
jgi:23S rRNA (adenine2503-C2)-methyltransferase